MYKDVKGILATQGDVPALEAYLIGMGNRVSRLRFHLTCVIALFVWRNS